MFSQNVDAIYLQGNNSCLFLSMGQTKASFLLRYFSSLSGIEPRTLGHELAAPSTRPPPRPTHINFFYCASFVHSTKCNFHFHYYKHLFKIISSESARLLNLGGFLQFSAVSLPDSWYTRWTRPPQPRRSPPRTHPEGSCPYPTRKNAPTVSE